MLIELRVRNVAVLEDLTLRLTAGLNVITGETGAGKSIVIDALGLLMGARASSDLVRAGTDRAVVEGVLDVSGREELHARLHALGFDAEDGHIVLRREVTRAGRSRAWINGSPTTATVLRDLSEGLVDVHGQHEHQRLLSPSIQTEVLDAFAGSTGQAADVGALYARLGELTRV
ncbi:MAG: AAA family ATPase, partial [Gemmatimonadetes bacterium]|nr:AAA family ATPase [Gemmatimonadota bacterium]